MMERQQCQLEVREVHTKHTINSLQNNFSTQLPTHMKVGSNHEEFLPSGHIYVANASKVRIANRVIRRCFYQYSRGGYALIKKSAIQFSRRVT